MDSKLLKILKHKENYRQLIGILDRKNIGSEASGILDDYGKYFDKFEGAEVVDASELIFMVAALTGRFPTNEDKALHKSMVHAAMTDVDEPTRKGIVRVLHETSYASKVAAEVIRYRDGQEVDLMASCQIHLNDFKLAMKADDNVGGFIDTDIGTILDEDLNPASGITWRLEPLRRTMRPFQGGDFGIIAGRPDKGKTSFLASELTHMATQTGDRPILWLNNEGPGKRIYPRLYQAALNKTFPEIMEMHRAGTLAQAYREAVGDPFKIRIKDIHGFNIGQVERVIEEQNPALVVYDMVDSIRGFGDAARTDLALERMYQQCRELAVLHDHVGFATSQISVDGDGSLYPLMHMLKDSKTGKQGASDFILMLGSSNDESMASLRGIGLPKNKLMMAGQPKCPREEVNFNEATARYEVIQS